MVAPVKRSPTGFHYDIMSIGDFKPITGLDKRGKTVLTGLDSDSLGPVEISKRFMSSLLSRFGQSNSVFKYFSHEEVFTRIAQTDANDQIRVCVEQGCQKPGFQGRLLAVSNPAKGFIQHGDAMEVLSRFQGGNVAYEDGIITSVHSPRSGDSIFMIGSDEFSNRYQMNTPIDGYGKPTLYLSLLRQVCTNGAVGFAKAFKNELAGGDDVAAAMVRALDAFDSSEGYDALRQRFTASLTSEASVFEGMKLYKRLAQISTAGTLTGEGVFKKFHAMTGDINAMYGLANVDSLSEKRQRTLPIKATVYQLLNFASELATHHTLPGGERMLQAFIGDIVSNEFDLEGSLESADQAKRSKMDRNSTDLFFDAGDFVGSASAADLELAGVGDDE